MKRKSFLQSMGLLTFAGVSVEKRIKSYGSLCKTDRDAEGPFYKKGAPFRVTITSEGERLSISGTVFTADPCGMPVANAIIDIWHCDSSGKYDMDGFACRAQLKSGDDGRFIFNTILPPPYGNRPRHIHFKIHAENYPELTTQLYFEGDPNIKNDFAKNAAKDRVIALLEKDGKKTGVFNIYI